MEEFKFYGRFFRLDGGELWHRFDGFYGYPAFAVSSGLLDKMRHARKATGVTQDFATSVAEHGIRPILAPYVEGAAMLIKAERGPAWALDDDPDAHYFEVYIKEQADYERIQAHAADLDWPDINDEDDD